MVNCVFFEEEFKTPYRANIAEQIFIFGFLFMMLVIIGLLIFDFINSKFQICKKYKEK